MKNYLYTVTFRLLLRCTPPVRVLDMSKSVVAADAQQAIEKTVEATRHYVGTDIHGSYHAGTPVAKFTAIEATRGPEVHVV